MAWMAICVKVSTLLLVFFVVSQAQSAESGSRLLCPHLTLIGELYPDLNDVEKRLVCGDPEKNPGYPNEGWRKIPFSQAKYSLTNFLQARGYLHPLFYAESDHESAKVNIGWQSVVTQIMVEGAEDVVRIEQKRKVLGQP